MRKEWKYHIWPHTKNIYNRLTPAFMEKKSCNCAKRWAYPPSTFNQSFWCQPMDGGGRRQEDGVARRSVLTRWGGGQSVTSLQTPIKLSPQRAERTHSSEKRPVRDNTGALDAGQTGWTAMEAQVAMPFDSLTLLWFSPVNILSSFFHPPFLSAKQRREWSKHRARRALRQNRPNTSPSASASTRSWEPVQSRRTGARLVGKADPMWAPGLGTVITVWGARPRPARHHTPRCRSPSPV